MKTKKTSNKTTIILVVSIFFLMIMNAISENIRGVFIPVFKSQFQINNTDIGIYLFIGSLGYVFSTFIGGFLCERVGQKKVLVIGILNMIISLMIFSKSMVFNSLLIGMFIMNLGLGFTSIAINTLIPILLLTYQAVLMNVTHFCYGIGASIGPKIAGNLISDGVNWRNIYFYIGIFFILLFFIFIFLKVPNVYKKNEVKEEYKVNKQLILMFIITIGFYVCAEVGTGSWLINYMKNVYSYNEASSATYLSAFFGTLTIGRLLGGAVVEKFGYISTMIKSLILAFSLYTIALLIGKNGFILISISGLFFSIIYPTTMVVISKVFKKRTSFITGIIVTISSIINMFMNIIIGRLNDLIGCMITFWIIPLCLFISALFMIMIKIKVKQKN